MSLKGLSYREVARKLSKAGFKEVRHKGSHVKFAKETKEGRRTATIPKHKEIALGTLHSILRQSRTKRRRIQRIVKKKWHQSWLIEQNSIPFDQSKVL